VTPSASLLIDHYGENWATLWWVRLDGSVRVIESGAERDQALERLRSKYEQYVREPPPGPVIAIDITNWRAWP
jgi:PPOX class probable F420-dependent enzyme